MKYFFISLLFLILFTSCNYPPFEYLVYSGSKIAFKILPKDIAFYDTSQIRANIEIHELRLKNDFFKKDTIKLIYPIKIKCFIKGKEFFSSSMFHKKQSQPRLWVNFHFRYSCENLWNFPEKGEQRLKQGDTLYLNTQNICNSIEFFHQKNLYDKKGKYSNSKRVQEYKKKNKLAHEILLDSFYLKAMKKNNILIK